MFRRERLEGIGPPTVGKYGPPKFRLSKAVGTGAATTGNYVSNFPNQRAESMGFVPSAETDRLTHGRCRSDADCWRKLYSLVIRHYPTRVNLLMLFRKQTLVIKRTQSLPTMSLWLSNFIRSWPLLTYAVTWVTVMTLMVAVASLSPEVAFVSAISSSEKCKSTSDGFLVRVRVPLEETPCFPAHLLTKSNMDVIVPPVFAALIVAACACVVRAVGLWEHD
ncbi:hypothetical protein E2542_SST24345 [Spatholobus suberectus]|nr:hypothetical protein E2542_SST24345 [Spatholobus suberectus]